MNYCSCDISGVSQDGIGDVQGERFTPLGRRASKVLVGNADALSRLYVHRRPSSSFRLLTNDYRSVSFFDDVGIASLDEAQQFDRKFTWTVFVIHKHQIAAWADPAKAANDCLHAVNHLFALHVDQAHQILVSC